MRSDLESTISIENKLDPLLKMPGTIQANTVFKWAVALVWEVGPPTRDPVQSINRTEVINNTIGWRNDSSDRYYVWTSHPRRWSIHHR